MVLLKSFLLELKQQDGDLNKSTQITLPRISFEMTGIDYSPRRKTSTTQTFKTRPVDSKASSRKVYMPVPYDVKFELSVMAKTNEDALQIVEQILPYFQLHFTMTVNLVKEIGEKRDIPVILDSINMQDDYEGNFDTRRTMVYTMNFTAQTYLFGPVPQDSDGVIKRATIDYMTGGDVRSPRREMRYSVTPRATQDYNDDATTTLSEDISPDTATVKVADASSISVRTYISIGTEEFFVKSKSGNTLKSSSWTRWDCQTTTPLWRCCQSAHRADDALIEIGDDFGFNETTSFFQDFKNSIVLHRMPTLIHDRQIFKIE